MPMFRRSLSIALGGLICAAALAAQDGAARTIPEDKDPVKTDSGLEYSVLRAGDADGVHPRRGDRVRVQYTGWLTNGTVFDSSHDRGVPAEFAVGQVIEGWNEGLGLMTVGGHYKFTIPSDMAYGKAGFPPKIGADETLVFEVELLGITPAPTFAALREGQTAKTDSGLTYDVVAFGEGEPPGDDTPVEMNFTVWNADGKLVHCSNTMGGTRYTVPARLRFGVLREAAKLLKPGGALVAEVPPALAFGDRGAGDELPGGSTSTWRVELNGTFTLPEFVQPPDEELKSTDSGLKYKVIREGRGGGSPVMGQNVTVHYAGWNTAGNMFDNSYERGDASSFRLGQVIQGWNEGLQLMTPGAVYKFVIPGDLAYGENGKPPKIGPNATLIFHVELLAYR